MIDILLAIVFFFVAFIVIGLILLQEGKGGGITAMGGSAMDNMMGGKNPLRRWTTYFFIAFILLTLTMEYRINRVRSRNVPVKEGLAAKEKKAETETPIKTTPDGKPVGVTAEPLKTGDATEKATAPETESTKTATEDKPAEEKAPATDQTTKE